jgi:hypothetical protein
MGEFYKTTNADGRRTVEATVFPAERIRDTFIRLTRDTREIFRIRLADMGNDETARFIQAQPDADEFRALIRKGVDAVEQLINMVLTKAGRAECPRCGGQGGATFDGVYYPCPRCDGAGTIPAETIHPVERDGEAQ